MRWCVAAYVSGSLVTALVSLVAPLWARVLIGALVGGPLLMLCILRAEKER
jgi:hypothetical protein